MLDDGLTGLYGNDYNSVGDRAFSTYMEIGYDAKIGDQPLQRHAVGLVGKHIRQTLGFPDFVQPDLISRR